MPDIGGFSYPTFHAFQGPQWPDQAQPGRNYKKITTNNPDLGKPSFWTFATHDPDTDAEIKSVDLRIPPQNLDIQRPIRSQVSQDLAGNAVVVQAGVGLARWTLAGTHGSGLNPAGIKEAQASHAAVVDKYGQLSAGLAARYALLEFFEDFAKTNFDRINQGKEPYTMVLTIHGGGPAEMPWDSWEIMPDELPRDRRDQGAPLAWNWSLSFWGLVHRSSPNSARATNYLPQITYIGAAMALPPLIDALSVLAQLRNLARQIKQFVSQVQAFKTAILAAVHEVEDIVNGVLNLALLVSQTASSLLSGLKGAFADEKDFVKGEARQIRDAVMAIKILAGAVARAAQMPADRLTASTSYPATLAPNKASSASSPATGSTASKPAVLPVVPGDTIQALAARGLGDATQWPALVALNNLVYPYLDFSGPGGMASPALQGAGLAQPMTTDPITGAAVVDTSDPLYLPNPPALGLPGRVLGAGDVLALPLVGGRQAPADPIGWDTDEGGGCDGAGNPLVVQGKANLAAALLRRLRCPAGWLPYHPDYGAGLQAYVGADLSIPTILALRRDVANSLMEDPRVIQVLGVSATVQDDAVLINAYVQTPLGAIQVAGSLIPSPYAQAAQANS